MMSAAATEVGHYLGVPTMNPAMSTDARYPGIQAGYEKALKALTVCSANPDLVSGWGLIDSSSALYLPQIVIDNEIALMVRRMLSEVEVSKSSIMPDAFARVGIGGDFLREKETARRARAGEHFLPQIANRLSYERWQEIGATEDDAARAVIDRVMAARADRRPGLSDGPARRARRHLWRGGPDLRVARPGRRDATSEGQQPPDAALARAQVDEPRRHHVVHRDAEVEGEDALLGVATARRLAGDDVAQVLEPRHRQLAEVGPLGHRRADLGDVVAHQAVAGGHRRRRPGRVVVERDRQGAGLEEAGAERRSRPRPHRDRAHHDARPAADLRRLGAGEQESAGKRALISSTNARCAVADTS